MNGSPHDYVPHCSPIEQQQQHQHHHQHQQQMPSTTTTTPMTSAVAGAAGAASEGCCCTSSSSIATSPPPPPPTTLSPKSGLGIVVLPQHQQQHQHQHQHQQLIQPPQMPSSTTSSSSQVSCQNHNHNHIGSSSSSSSQVPHPAPAPAPHPAHPYGTATTTPTTTTTNSTQVPAPASASASSTNSAATANAMFRVQMWSNNYDSGVQSLNHSSAPSVLSMSSLRAASQMSTMSEDAQNRIELTDQQQMKFENIPSNIGRGSQDGETRNAIPELIHLLSDSDEVVVQRAATMVQNIAKMDSEQPPYTEPLLRASEVIPSLKELLRTRSNSPAIIKPTLGALFQISERRDGLESILRVNEQTNGALLTDIIQHIKFTYAPERMIDATLYNRCNNGFSGGSAIRYAILTFHTIIADRSVSDNRNVERARASGALQAVTYFLDRETNEKLLSVLVECVRLLCDKSQSQRMLFLQLNGPSKLFHILRNLRYEGLLWRTTQLLKTFSNADPQAIIICGGYDVLHRQLEHASQRLITSTLECIRNMSDVPTKDLDVSALLTKLLQLLGAVDPVVVLYCTGILSNLLANNQRNKEFLYSRGAIIALYRVLINSYGIPATTPNQQQRVEDIQERALATLRHLCVGHSQQIDAQKAVLQTEFAAEFLLRKLTEMRPSILKQTLQILNKAVLQDSNLPIIRETRVRMTPDYEATFVDRIVLVLKVASEQLPGTQMVEEVRVAELIQLSLSTLQLLCRDPHLIHQVIYMIRRPDYMLYRECDSSVMLPVFCLYQGYVEDENLKRSALGLISELALHPEMAAIYASDNTLVSAFEHYSHSRNQAFATYATKAYERTMQGGNAALLYGHHPASSATPSSMRPTTLAHGAGAAAVAPHSHPTSSSSAYGTNYTPVAAQHYPTTPPGCCYSSGTAAAAAAAAGYMNTTAMPYQQPGQAPASGPPLQSHCNHPSMPSGPTSAQQQPQQQQPPPLPTSAALPHYHPFVAATTSQEALNATGNASDIGGQLYGRESCPSSQQQCCSSTQSTTMECSPDIWPDDLSGLSLNDDPFANMFCSQPFDSSPQQRNPQQAQQSQQQQQQQQHHTRNPYPTGGRGHETTGGTLYCSPGPPGAGYVQAMQNVNMGSPEAPASWPDPSIAYGSYPL